MIQNVESFARYFESIRRRTLTFASAIPPANMDWSPPGEGLTCGDLLRHIAAIEAISVYAVVNGRWKPYAGHERWIAPDLDALFQYLDRTHSQAMTLLRTLPDEGLHQARVGLDNQPIKAWRLLMAMVEHEVHHRSQLACYLALMGVEPPQLYGLGVEDVAKMSKKLAQGKDN